jgi:hypothetical protein
MSEFDTFFAHYAERYMASDVDAISDLYEAPLLAVREGRAIHLSDRDAVREHLSVETLGKSAANATVHWHVCAAEGDLLKDFRTTYHLLRSDGNWRVLAYTNHGD